MFCSKCGKNMSDDALFCSECGNKLRDVPAVRTENPPGCGHLKVVFDTVNIKLPRLYMTVMETQDKAELFNGESADFFLGEGEYTLSFVFGDRKIYKRMLRIYSENTDVTVSASSTRARNSITVYYSDGIMMPEIMRRYDGYTAYDFEKRLLQLGVQYVEMIQDRSNPGRVRAVGMIQDVKVDGKSFRTIPWNEVKLSSEAKITIVYSD